MKRGYSYEPFYRELYLGCALTQKNYHIISPNGMLYKCINAIENNDYFLADVEDYNSIKYKKKLENYMNYEINYSKCKKCTFYPVCFGGCHYKNKLKGFRCSKQEFIDNEVPLIKEIVNARCSKPKKEF